MVLIIHGFPNNISALRFEWALQQPKTSRRLKNNVSLMKKNQKETFFDYTFRIVTEMLSIGPWNRLPLKIRWLDSGFKKEFPIDRLPPHHMDTFEGIIIQKSKSRKKKVDEEVPEEFVSCFCILCLNYIDTEVSKKLLCINSDCRFVSHIECLGKLWVDIGHYVPIEGSCPTCGKRFLWNDVISHSFGYVKCKKGGEENEEEMEDLNSQIEILSDSDDDFLTQII